MRLIRRVMGVSLQEHRRREDAESIFVMTRRRMQQFGHVKRRREREVLRVAEDIIFINVSLTGLIFIASTCLM